MVPKKKVPILKDLCNDMTEKASPDQRIFKYKVTCMKTSDINLAQNLHTASTTIALRMSIAATLVHASVDRQLFCSIYNVCISYSGVLTKECTYKK